MKWISLRSLGAIFFLLCISAEADAWHQFLNQKYLPKSKSKEPKQHLVFEFCQMFLFGSLKKEKKESIKKSQFGKKMLRLLLSQEVQPNNFNKL